MKVSADTIHAWLRGMPAERLGLSEDVIRREFVKLSHGTMKLYRDIGAIIHATDERAQTSAGSADPYLTGVRHGMLDASQRLAQVMGHMANRLLLGTVSGEEGEE